ncbi:hypothetical protein, partial [Candidatus Symbiopectobacterium sp. NZEC135]|uniref:hypothetical protein n=1 Tax=Candidatus Symbiopectobacterium sp. NZEC135 TaxID=2820471 RepID=UPI00222613F8
IADSVRFTRSCGIAKSTLEHYFGCPVFFDEGIAQIDFSLQWLNRPTPALNSALRTQAERLAATVAGRIRDKHSLLQFLQAHLDTIHSADDMARLLSISRRTATPFCRVKCVSPKPVACCAAVLPQSISPSA